MVLTLKIHLYQVGLIPSRQRVMVNGLIQHGRLGIVFKTFLSGHVVLMTFLQKTSSSAEQEVFSFTLLPNPSLTYILSYMSNEVLNEKEVHL